jgi:hypothetical protein
VTFHSIHGDAMLFLTLGRLLGFPFLDLHTVVVANGVWGGDECRCRWRGRLRSEGAEEASTVIAIATVVVVIFVGSGKYCITILLLCICAIVIIPVKLLPILIAFGGQPRTRRFRAGRRIKLVHYGKVPQGPAQPAIRSPSAGSRALLLALASPRKVVKAGLRQECGSPWHAAGFQMGEKGGGGRMSGRGSWDIVGLCGNIRGMDGMERVGDSRASYCSTATPAGAGATVAQPAPGDLIQYLGNVCMRRVRGGLVSTE